MPLVSWTQRILAEQSILFLFSFLCFVFFKILLPRLDVGQESSTVLDLANFSTLIIDVPSPDVTLVLKMEPSEEISFMVFLGYKDYPNDETCVAKTKIPREKVKEGLYWKHIFFCIINLTTCIKMFSIFYLFSKHFMDLHILIHFPSTFFGWNCISDSES